MLFLLPDIFPFDSSHNPAASVDSSFCSNVKGAFPNPVSKMVPPSHPTSSLHALLGFLQSTSQDLWEFCLSPCVLS